MPHRLYFGIGVLIALILFASTLRDLFYAAPHIMNFDRLPSEEQRRLVRDVVQISNGVYTLHPVLIAFILTGPFCIGKRTGLAGDLMFLGLMAGTVYLYMIEWLLLDYLIPGDIDPEDWIGIILVLVCIGAIHFHRKRMRAKN